MNTLITLGIVALVLFLVSRAAGNPLNHDWAFRRRRLLNWLPLGLTYAFLYMGRYNLTESKNALGNLMSNADFGIIFAAGTLTYACSFLINGPLTDRIGGRKAILIGASGAAVMNAVLGVVTYLILTRPALGINLVLTFSIVYALNMYFQSFGAVSIVKVNSNWFHVRERGGFGGIFGVLISLGIYFAFDWSGAVVEAVRVKAPQQLDLFQGLLRKIIVGPDATHDQLWYVFFIPAGILAACAIFEFFVLRDHPSQAGLKDFDTADASSGEENQTFSTVEVLRKILTNKTILTIAAIEFCSGVLRNGIMHWYRIYSKQIGLPKTFLFRQHWGLLLAIAGSCGGIFAGLLSDKVFGSRRGPVAALLYGMMVALTVLMIFVLKLDYVLGVVAVLMSMAVIGVHGMLSGTATMDFGGRKAAGTAVGVIDGFVYLGTGVQSLALGFITSRDWQFWPIFLVPFSILGLVLAFKIWRAFPGPAKKGTGAH